MVRGAFFATQIKYCEELLHKNVVFSFHRFFATVPCIKKKLRQENRWKKRRRKKQDNDDEEKEKKEEDDSAFPMIILLCSWIGVCQEQEASRCAREKKDVVHLQACSSTQRQIDEGQNGEGEHHGKETWAGIGLGRNSRMRVRASRDEAAEGGREWCKVRIGKSGRDLERQC